MNSRFAVTVLPWLISAAMILMATPAKAGDDPKLVAAAQKGGFHMVTPTKADIWLIEGGDPEPYAAPGVKIGKFLLNPFSGQLYKAMRDKQGLNHYVAQIGGNDDWFFEKNDRLVKAGFNADGSKLCLIIASAATHYKWGMSCYRRVNQGNAQKPYLVYVEDAETLGRLF